VSAPSRIVANQAQIFLRQLAVLRPHWRDDRALPLRIQRLLAGGRGFGARDRRLYRELLYTTLRHLPWIEPWLDREPARAVKIAAWLAADTRDTAAFRADLCADWPAVGSLAERAAFLEADAATLLPAWFRDHRPELFEFPELEAQLSRAPLWLRLQTNAPETVFREFAAHGWFWNPSGILPEAIRLGEVSETKTPASRSVSGRGADLLRLPAPDVTKSDAYRAGLVEVQDLGSQLVLAAAGVAAGGRWLDACAGAGGKTLQLARLVGPGGGVDAHDPRAAALAELKLRAGRSHLTNIAIVPRPAVEAYDHVLVDAPCSGSGTWRRAPHLKWSTTPADIAAFAARQLDILRHHARAVRPGGRLVYATCSLSHQENEEVAGLFLAAEPGFIPEPVRERFGHLGTGPAVTILPARHDTDGFFVATFRRR
jgi:16S rRNA (cytosine967-C5)-methyltransferase